MSLTVSLTSTPRLFRRRNDAVDHAAGLELKENLASGAAWPYPSVYHPYDAAFAGYPFNGCPDRNKKKEVLCRHHLYGVSLLEEVLPTPPPYPLVRCHCPDDTLDLRRKLRHCISGDPARLSACLSFCARILLPGLHALLSGVPLIIISVSFSPYFMSDLFSTLPPCSPEQMRECSPPLPYTLTSAARLRDDTRVSTFLPWIHECRPLTVDTRVSTSYPGYTSVDLLPWIHECQPLTVDTRVSTSHRDYTSVNLLPWIHECRPLTVDT
uniref:Uncharacterized protein n=1 Tax=Timema douglasi TaxID=61478 RepID=A0A7R8VBP7_TIMDO|nr:unnamed protein product [Timema douglasi]